MVASVNMPTLIARFMGPTWADLGPVGPRWAPCRPHEPCYLRNCRTLTLTAHFVEGQLTTLTCRSQRSCGLGTGQWCPVRSALWDRHDGHHTLKMTTAKSLPASGISIIQCNWNIKMPWVVSPSFNGEITERNMRTISIAVISYMATKRNSCAIPRYHMSGIIYYHSVSRYNFVIYFQV